MKTKCCNYNECRKPIQLCNNKCKAFDKTCFDCHHKIGEECGIHGYEVYDDSVPCDEFADMHE